MRILKFTLPGILLFLPFALHLKVPAQTAPAQSSQKTHDPQLSDEGKIESLLSLSKKRLNRQPAIALEFANMAIARARESNNKIGEGRAWLMAGTAASTLGRQCDALHAAQMAEALFELENRPLELARVKKLFAQAHSKLGALESARREAIEGLQLAEGDSNQWLRAEFLVLLTNISSLADQYDTAQEYLLSADSLISSEAPVMLRAKQKLTRAQLLSSMGKVAVARETVEAALQLARKEEDKAMIGNCLLLLTRFEIAENDLPKAQKNLAEAASIVEETGNRYLSLGVKTKQASLSSIGGNAKSSLEQLQIAFELSQQLEALKENAMILLRIARVHWTVRADALAMKYAQKSIQLAESGGFTRIQGIGYMELAKIYQHTNEMEDAQTYLSKSEEIAKKIGLNALWLDVLTLHIEMKNEGKDYPKAIEYAEEALKVATSLNWEQNKLNMQFGLSYYNYANGSHDEARKWLEMCLNNQLAMEAYKNSALQIYSFAGQFYRLFDVDKGIAYLNKALELNRELKRGDIDRQAYYFLAMIYEKKGDLTSALRYQKLLGSTKDSLSKVGNTQQMALLKTQFETERKDKELAAIKKDQKLQELLLNNQKAELLQKKQYLIILVLFVMMVLVLGVLFFYRLRLLQKAEKLELEKETREASQKLEMEALKTRFFTDVSHELRTPLTLIKGPLDQMVTTREISSVDQLDIMQRNTGRLIELVNQTLDLSKIESGYTMLYLEQHVLAEMVRNIGRSFSSISEQKDIHFEVIDHSNNMAVDMDVAKLEMVLTNLLGNAFEHTPIGGEIQAVISPAQCRVKGMTQPGVQVAVFDSGPGIASEHLPHLFKRFYQVNAAGRKGSGIGLTLTKEIIELHQGSIAVSSQLGQGSTFSFSLPLKQESAVGQAVFVDGMLATKSLNGESDVSEDEVNGHAGFVLGRAVVLIVDDNADMLTYLKSILAPEFEVLTASEGEAAIATAGKRTVDLIVSDVMMPGKDGFEVTHTLKNQFATSHIPIVLLTAKASRESKLIGLENGADDYLVKPFDAAELQVRIRNLIQQRKQLRSVFANGETEAPPALKRHKLDEVFLEKALEVANSNLHNPNFSVVEFCHELALNRTSVHLKMKALTGMSASQFIKHLRVNKAARLIEDGDESIAAIADMVGFGNRTTFNKSFKEHFKVTPTDFARRLTVG